LGPCQEFSIYTTGRRNHRLGITSDITDSKNAELELQESKQRLSNIIDFLPDATFALDKAGKVIAWNRAIEEMTGIGRSDMIGQSDYALYSTLLRPSKADVAGSPG